jgi:hypothetical protein
MHSKFKIHTAQEYMQAGMGLFMLGLFFTILSNGRLMGISFAPNIHQHSWLDFFQGVATGCSIPIFCASIYFNIRGLFLFRHS